MPMSRLALLFRSSFTAALAISALAAALSLGARELGLWQRPEFVLYDRLILSTATAAGATPIVLVLVREQDIDRFGHPLRDELLAQAVERIASAGARTIGVDLFRPEALPPGTGRLDQALRRHKVILVRKLEAGGLPGVDPPPYAEPEQVGFSDVPVDVDGVVRRALLIAWDEDENPSLSVSLQLALSYLAHEGVELGPDPVRQDGLLLGRYALPHFTTDLGGYVSADDRGYQVLLDFARLADPWPSVSFSEVMDGAYDQDRFRDRIVLIGTTASSVKDLFDTPYTGGGLATAFGVDIHAHVIDQLIRTARGQALPIRALAEAWESLLVLAFAAAGAALALLIRSTLVQALGALAALATLVGAAMLAFAAGLWLPMTPSFGAFALAGVLGVVVSGRRERAEKEQIRGLFGRYVPSGVVDLIWEQRHELLEGSRPKTVELPVTVLMVDAGGSTRRVHSLPVMTAARWLDAYIEMMARIVHDAGGVVGDYAGDGFKADFGVPVPREDPREIEEDARRAVRAALAIGPEVEKLNARMADEGLPTARIRMGVASGAVAAGSVGSADELRYATVGHAANIAAHLESLQKEEFEDEDQVWRVLIADSTRALLGDAFTTRSLGEHTLKGVEVEVFRVLGPGAPRGR